MFLLSAHFLTPRDAVLNLNMRDPAGALRVCWCYAFGNNGARAPFGMELKWMGNNLVKT